MAILQTENSLPIFILMYHQIEVGPAWGASLPKQPQLFMKNAN
jgi:hypothetical protein